MAATAPPDDLVRLKAEYLQADANYRRICLRFPTGGDYKDFLTEWDDALFENSYGKEATPANRRKVFGEDFENWASGEDPEVSQPRTERSALWVTACRGDNGRGAGR